MSQLNFKQLNQIPTTLKQPKFDLIEYLRLKRLENSNLNDLFDFCVCAHLETGHKLGIGECSYSECNCKSFDQIEFYLNIPILWLDIFKFENPDGFLEDDPRFWIEFEMWRKKNDNLHVL